MPQPRQNKRAAKQKPFNWQLVAVVAIVVAAALFIMFMSGLSNNTKVSTNSKAAPANTAAAQMQKRIALNNLLSTTQGKAMQQSADNQCESSGPVGTNVQINTSGDFCKANWNPIISCDKEGYTADYTSNCGDFFTGFFRACCRKSEELKKVDAKKNEFCGSRGLSAQCLVTCAGDSTDYKREKPEADGLGRQSDTKCAAFAGGLGLDLGAFKSLDCCTTDPGRFSKR